MCNANLHSHPDHITNGCCMHLNNCGGSAERTGIRDWKPVTSCHMALLDSEAGSREMSTMHHAPDRDGIIDQSGTLTPGVAQHQETHGTPQRRKPTKRTTKLIGQFELILHPSVVLAGQTTADWHGHNQFVSYHS